MATDILSSSVLNDDKNMDLKNLASSFIVDYKKKFIDKDISNTFESNNYEGADDKCSNCDSMDLVQIDGYYTCRECGTCLNEVIDSGQEWRYYGQYDNKATNPARCGIPTSDLIPNSSIGSIIANQGFETYAMKRIRKIQSWGSTNYKDTTLMNSFNNMNIMASNSGIPQCIIEEAKHMFKKISSVKSYKKAKKDAVQAACIQRACKMNNVPRDSSEMATIFGISKKDMRKGAKQFEEIWNALRTQEKYEREQKVKKHRETNPEYIDNEEQDNNYKPSNSIDYLHRNCSKLNLNEDIYDICSDICRYIEEEDYLVKHIPLSRTAGAIYFCCQCLNFDIDKQSITSVCNVSEVTINKCYQKLLKIRDQIILNTKLSKYVSV